MSLRQRITYTISRLTPRTPYGRLVSLWKQRAQQRQEIKRLIRKCDFALWELRK